ncbi:MAG: hypothetical protein MJZ25_08555 [Fibrobacter sp.]|nr:hypothetical protein [Fibrobacter sp.]
MTVQVCPTAEEKLSRNAEFFFFDPTASTRLQDDDLESTKEPPEHREVF